MLRSLNEGSFFIKVDEEIYEVTYDVTMDSYQELIQIIKETIDEYKRVAGTWIWYDEIQYSHHSVNFMLIPKLPVGESLSLKLTTR